MSEMIALCEQMCVESHSLMDGDALDLTRKLMNSLYPELEGCNRQRYIWIFTHVAALAMQITEARLGEDPLPGERWAEFISNNLRTH